MALNQEKAARRAARERELAGKIAALPDRKYGLIYADPEWRFDPYSRDTGMDRAADNHYPTSPLAAILARDVPSIAARDCILALWVTVPLLEQGFLVLNRWGFFYKSMLTWDKVSIGTGFWFRNQTEHLLIGTQGQPVAPAMGRQLPSLWREPRTAHSAKPTGILDWFDANYPTTPRIELNRRGPPRPGWDAWGNEVETSE